MNIWKNLLLGFGTVTLSFSLAACDIEQTEEGELPDVDVEGGNLPEYDVDYPDVDVDMEERDVTVPDIDVDLEEREVPVPDVDITPPDAGEPDVEPES